MASFSWELMTGFSVVTAVFCYTVGKKMIMLQPNISDFHRVVERPGRISFKAIGWILVLMENDLWEIKRRLRKINQTVDNLLNTIQK